MLALALTKEAGVQRIVRRALPHSPRRAAARAAAHVRTGGESGADDDSRR
jgi:hypothetical protein